MNALPAGIGRTGDLCVQAATRIRHAALEVRSFMQLPKVFADRNGDPGRHQLQGG